MFVEEAFVIKVTSFRILYYVAHFHASRTDHHFGFIHICALKWTLKQLLFLTNLFFA